MNSEFPSYSFKVEFFDERAELVRPYVLLYHTQKGEIELYDVRQKKMFLKRTTNHSIELKDLYIGNKILINGRQYDIMDYSDQSTQRTFNSGTQHTFAMILPGFSQRMGEAIERIQQNDLVVAKLQFGYLSNDAASRIFEGNNGMVQYVTSGPVVAMELVGKDAVARWNKILGNPDPSAARMESPDSLRALFGRNATENFGYGSSAPSNSAKELDFVFNGRAVSLSSERNRSTLCVIKPHAVKEGLAGSIIKQIVAAGFTIGGAMMTTLEISTAQEFLEVYKGVVPEFADMSSEMSSGSCIALELVKDNAVNDFRQLCGPRDVNVAKQIRPKSLRAVFGTNIVRNAVHCTDLEEDASLEVEYFFILLDQ
jgi:nucleoside-diphosphate kinase